MGIVKDLYSLITQKMTSRDGSSNRGSVGVQEWASKRKD